MLTTGLPSARAQQLRGQLKILDMTANGGLNPTTGAPWARGDTYRFIFVTSIGTNAVSTVLSDYNDFVQSVANGSSALPQLKTVTWKVLGSTTNLNEDARTNSSTNPGVDGTGESIFLLDGATRFAANYSALWSAGKTNTVTISEELNEITGPVFTGTSGTGVVDSSQPLGNASGGVLHGECTRTDGVAWIRIYNSSSTSILPFYALSEPLVITPPGGTLVTLY